MLFPFPPSKVGLAQLPDKLERDDQRIPAWSGRHVECSYCKLLPETRLVRCNLERNKKESRQLRERVGGTAQFPSFMVVRVLSTLLQSRHISTSSEKRPGAH